MPLICCIVFEKKYEQSWYWWKKRGIQSLKVMLRVLRLKLPYQVSDFDETETPDI